MAKIYTDETEAIAQVKKKCAYAHTPTIEEQDIIDSLADNRVVEVWEPETNYVVGQIVAPTEDSRVGRFLKCVTSGASGAEEPDWQIVADRSSRVLGGTIVGNTGSARIVVSDGDTGWVDAGPETDFWDMEQTFYDIWMLKASLVADLPNSNRSGNNYEFNRIYQNCIDQANRYGGKFIK
jgi:hypothetical protein